MGETQYLNDDAAEAARLVESVPLPSVLAALRW